MKKEKFTAKDMIDTLKETKGMVYIAARKLGCSHTTVYTYAKRYPSVQAAIDEHRGHFVDTCELALERAVLAGEGWAVCFSLKTLGKDRGYVERQQIEHDVRKLSNEELIARATGILRGNSEAGPDSSSSG